MTVLKRILFLPALIAATVLAGVAAREAPDRLTYAGLAVVAALWTVVALRTVLLVGKVMFWFSVIAVLTGTYFAGPYVLAVLNR